MLMVSREMGSRPLGVILTVRRAVFICGETEVIVPWRIVPVPHISCHWMERVLGRWLLSRTRGGNTTQRDAPFFNSIVTVSLAHFIRNLSQRVSLWMMAMGGLVAAPELRELGCKFRDGDVPDELHGGWIGVGTRWRVLQRGRLTGLSGSLGVFFRDRAS